LIPRGSVELFAVGRMPWTNIECWLPDGSPSSEPFPVGGIKLGDDSEFWSGMKKLAFRITVGFPDTVSQPVFRCDDTGDKGFAAVWMPQVGASASRVGPSNANELFEVLFDCPSNALTANFSVGVPSGPWIDAVVVGRQDALRVTGSRTSTTGATGSNLFSLHYAASAESDDSHLVKFTYSGGNGDGVMRVAYLTDDGITGVIPTDSSSTQESNSAALHFPARQYAHVKDFRLQYRPYQWVEFQSVSLSPGHRTQARATSVGALPPASPGVAELAPATSNSSPAGPGSQMLPNLPGSNVPARLIAAVTNFDGVGTNLQFRLVVPDSETNEDSDLLPLAYESRDGKTLAVHREILLSGTDMSSASLAVNQQVNQHEFQITLTPDGRRKFTQITAANVGRRLAIIWRGRIVSAPVIAQAITSREVVVTGSFSDKEALELLDLLNHRVPSND
jgi:hypothetical protein